MEQHAPVQVTSVSNVVSAAGGATFTLIVKGDGTAWACGSNGNGQLGDGTTTQRGIPVQMTGMSGLVVQVAAGVIGAHSLVLTNNGALWATGLNTYGQLGTGDTTQLLTLTKISGNATTSYAAAGTAHSVAIKSVDAMWTWGQGTNGQLGNGGMTQSLTPVQVPTF